MRAMIGRIGADRLWPSAGAGISSRQMLVAVHGEGGGRHVAAAAARTPGSVDMRASDSRCTALARETSDPVAGIRTRAARTPSER